MSRQELRDKLKQGPSLTHIAEQLNISRPTLYRHIENYMKGDDRNISTYLKEYFDKVVEDQFATEEEAEKELEQIRFFIDGETAKAREEYEQEWVDYRNDQHSFRYLMSDLTLEERIKKLEELDRRREELEAKGRELGLDRYSFFEEDSAVLKWNEGAIRSECLSTIEKTMILIDADFEKCRDITVEVMVKVSGQDFVMARVRPEEDRRYAEIDFLGIGAEYRYRLRWTEGDKVKTAGPYPIRSRTE